MADLVSTVAALLRDVATAEIVPRFRSLAEGEIREKGPGDLVTVADIAAEKALSAALTKLLPGSVVVGEEGVADDPTALSRLRSDRPVWVIDPVDGTRNFAAGETPFVSMIALVERGETMAGWILDPIRGEIATATLGGGMHLDGERVAISGSASAMAEWHGHFNMGKGGLRRRRGEAIRRRIGSQARLTSAGASYLMLARGEIDFAIFQNRNLMPWDHLPGTLMVREAGGHARIIPTGQDYRADRLEGPLLVARTEQTWEQIAHAFNSIR